MKTSLFFGPQKGRKNSEGVVGFWKESFSLVIEHLALQVEG
jgi:hypothetical protein